jgi:hypothetical protein
VTFQSAVLSSFLPQSGDLAAVAEFSLDFSGRVLTIGAELGVPASALTGAPYDPEVDTLLVARIERVDGIPRLVVVSLAALNGDRIVSQPHPAMQGLTRGGRYVLYRASLPIGVVAGQTTAAGQPVRAVVASQGLPFVGIAGYDGRYAMAVRAGAVQAEARVVRTSLAATAGAEVARGATALLDFMLAGAVTTAVVTPADGAVAVSPGIQIEIVAPNALAADSIGPTTVRLLHVGAAGDDEPSPGVEVDLRFVLAASGRVLALVPTARLTGDSRYRIEAAGLVDVFGGAVVVPATTFVTSADSAPEYDVSKLVVSFPDADGYVTLTGPEGTLPPGSEVLVINNGSGEVSTFPVQNDGSLTGRFFAVLTDRLQITITDTFGNVTTFNRNSYVRDDGMTSVNSGGGIVEGPTGAEVRVPEGALNPFDVALMRLSAIPQFLLGELQKIGAPGLVIAGGVRVESPGAAFFTEVDLAVPKPAAAGEHEIFFVLRRMDAPNGVSVYESLDFATVEGEGDDAKIVTASAPFPGFYGGGDAVIAHTVDQFTPGLPVGGVITGKVLRTVWRPGSSIPVYEAVAGALVSGVDAVGQPVWAQGGDASGELVAISQADGTYALFDTRYTGGPVTVTAVMPSGERVNGIAYEANPQDSKSPGLKLARHIATTNLTYPAAPPPQPLATVRITLTRTVDDVERAVTDGIVVAGTPIGVRLRSETDASLRDVTINGSPVTITADPAAAGEWLLGTPYVPAQPGVYTIVANAQPEIGDVVPSRLTFRAIAAGGGVSDPLPADPPIVVDGRTVPKRGASGVAVSAFPQITFSEPVRGITPASVTLTDPTGAMVPATIFGVGPDGPLGAIASSGAIVTSITLQPLAGLKYATTYTLRLTAAISDLDDGTNDTPANKPLVPYETTFTTFAPTELGATDEGFTAGGLAIVGDRAYVAQNEGPRTRVRLFDVSDPVQPVEIVGPDNPSYALHRPPPVQLIGTPADLAAEDDSPVTGGRLLAVATNPFSSPYHPANIRLYDVADDQTWHWIGAVTLGKEPQDGLIKRLVLRGTRLYALVAGQGKGLQVIDLPAARDLFTAKTGGEEGFAFYDLQQSIGLQGRGFGESSIVQTVFLETGAGLNSLMHDLAVLDLTVDGITQPIVPVTGRNPIAIVNPQTGQVLYNGALRNAAGTPVASWGYAIEAGFLNGTPVALVAAVPPGGVASSHVFVVVDLTNPADPRALGTLTLPGIAQSVHDIVLKGTTAYVGTEAGTYLVSLEDLGAPQLISTITAVGGRLGFADNVLFGSAKSNTVLQHALGGIRSSALERFLSLQAGQMTVPFDENNKTMTDVDVAYRVIGSAEPAQTIRVQVLRGDIAAQQLDAPFDGVQGETVWRSGSAVQPPAPYFVQATIDPGTENELSSRKVRLQVTDIDVIIEQQRQAFAAIVAAATEPIEDTWDESGRGLEPPINGFDLKNSSRTLAKAITTELGTPPSLPRDYVIMKIPTGAGLVWEESGGTTLRLEVPATGRVEGTLKATSELASLQIREIAITTEYFVDGEASRPLKLKDEKVRILNRRLNGHLANMVAGVFGRGEGFDARVAELGVGVLPFAGDAAGMLGEVFNALDPTTEISKVNLTLSVVGFATEFGVVSGPVGVALDKGIVFVRVGLKQVANVSGPLRQLPSRVYDMAKGRQWDQIVALSEGSLKVAMVGGGDFAARIVREEADLAALNTLVRRYSADVLDTRFVELLMRLDGIYGDPDAVRSAVRILAQVKDTSGAVVRLSDDAVEGAVRFIAHAGDSSAAARESLLRTMCLGSSAETELGLAFIKGAPDQETVRGIAAIINAVPACRF